MSTEVLHIPPTQIEFLKQKVLASCSKGEYVSSNDVLAGLIWTTVCQLRNRPLPGSEVESSEDASRFSLAVDLRKNGLDHCVPEALFGNASWFLNISGKPFMSYPNNCSLQGARRSVLMNTIHF